MVSNFYKFSQAPLLRDGPAMSLLFCRAQKRFFIWRFKAARGNLRLPVAIGVDQQQINRLAAHDP